MTTERFNQLEDIALEIRLLKSEVNAFSDRENRPEGYISPQTMVFADSLTPPMRKQIAAIITARINELTAEFEKL